MGTLSGEVNLPFSFLPPFVSSRKKFFALQVDPALEALCHQLRQTGSHKSISPFVKMAIEKEGKNETSGLASPESVSIHLN